MLLKFCRHSEFVPKTRDEGLVEEKKVSAPQEHSEPTPGSDLWQEPSASDQQGADRRDSQRAQEDEFDDYLKNMFM